jgi:hypothetical protein
MMTSNIASRPWVDGSRWRVAIELGSVCRLGIVRQSFDHNNHITTGLRHDGTPHGEGRSCL